MPVRDKPHPHREWWTIRFSEEQRASQLEYRTDLAALDAVNSYRALADPAYKPVELLHFTEYRRVEMEVFPLGPSPERVVAEVTRRVLEHAKENPVPTGQAGIEFAVKTTMEVLDEQG